MPQFYSADELSNLRNEANEECDDGYMTAAEIAEMISIIEAEEDRAYQASIEAEMNARMGDAHDPAEWF